MFSWASKSIDMYHQHYQAHQSTILAIIRDAKPSIAQHFRASKSIAKHHWALLSIAKYHQTWLSITVHCWTSPSISKHQQALMNITMYSQALLSIAENCWASHSIPEHHQASRSIAKDHRASDPIILAMINKTKGTLVHERERLTLLMVCFEYRVPQAWVPQAWVPKGWVPQSGLRYLRSS